MSCVFCRNAHTDDFLTSETDLSYFSVGQSLNGYGIQIRSGDSRPTEILFKDYNSKGVFKTVAIYKPRYCSNCGRYLFENFTNELKKRYIKPIINIVELRN